MPHAADALAGAELMVAYAAEKGLDLSAAEVDAIIAFREALSAKAQAIPQSIESHFWATTAKLAARIKPSTVEALRALAEYEKQGRKSPLSRTARRYWIWMWIVLGVALLFHAFYARIDKPIQSAELALSSFQDLDEEISNFIPEIELSDVKSSDIPAPQAPAINGHTYVTAVETFRRSIKKYCLSTFNYNTSVKKLDDGFAGRKSPISQFISSWLTHEAGTEQSIKELDIYRDLNCEKATTFNTTNAKIDEVRASINVLRMQIISRPFGDPLSIDILDGARSIRATLSQFVLPLMYGLLGAIASVVRSLSDSVSKVTFSRIDRLLYLMRVPLGALAGATVGLVFEAQTLTSLTGLTSLGIAFAVGYTVEIFFSALDGLITRLTASPQPAR